MSVSLASFFVFLGIYGLAASVIELNLLGLILSGLWTWYCLWLYGRRDPHRMVWVRHIRCDEQGLEVVHYWPWFIPSKRLAWDRVQSLRLTAPVDILAFRAVQSCIIQSQDGELAFLLDDGYGMNYLRDQQDLIQTVVNRAGLRPVAHDVFSKG